MPEPSSNPPLFSDRTAPQQREQRFPLAIVGSAGALVAILVGLLVVFGSHRKVAAPGQLLAPAPYALNLPVTQVAMSESTSLSGGKSTFIDGHIRNTGGSTVTGITAQVVFRNDEGMPPHLETTPLSLIRTRQPYVDTEPVSAAPLAPGAEQEFRLIFEAIPDNWNTQVPEIRLVKVATR